MQTVNIFHKFTKYIALLARGDSFLLMINYKDIFHNSRAPMLIIAPDTPVYTMLDVNNAYLTATNTCREDLIGKSVFGVFPANPTDDISKNIERTIYSFQQAIQTRQTHTMSNYRYDIPIPGTNEFEERFWTTSNTPVLNGEGEVIYFIHSPSNVTQLYKLQEKEKQNLETLTNRQQQLYGSFMQAPVGILIVKGSDHRVELINPPLCEIFGQHSGEMLGRSIFEALPHTRGMGFEEMLDRVRLTGSTERGTGLPADIVRNGVKERVYFNFVYVPYREAEGNISGVIAVATEVTDLVVAKTKIEEAEARARLAGDAVGLGTFDLDLLTGDMVTSKKFAQMFGFDDVVPRKEYIGVFHPDDLPIRDKAHAEAILTGSLMYEARVIWKDKSLRWLRVEGKVYYDPSGSACRILGILLDITEQRTSREEQSKLISLVENSVDLMSILKMDGFNAYINPAGKELLGFKDDAEVIATPVDELHDPADLQFVQTEVIPSVMQKGRWSGMMLVRHLQTREVFPVYNNCFRIDDPATGNPIAIGAVMRDMRPELAAKKALQDSEHLFRKITSAAPLGLWMSDHEGALTFVNETWVQWTGLTVEESTGQGWLSAVKQEHREATIEHWNTARLALTRYECEFILQHKDGDERWCIITGEPQYDPGGHFSGYIGACVDINEQKILQEQKDNFLGIASHELKTPVTTIKGYAQVLEKMFLQKGNVKEAQMMQRLDAQLKRLTNLIGDLLDVTKIRTGKMQFNPSGFSLSPVIQELVEDMQRTTDKHTIVFHATHDSEIYGDKERIEQVISNLVSNAIKYSPAGGEIRVTKRVDNGQAIVSVKDQGIGIPADKLDKVFEQFYRVTGDMQHTYPGLGLGLYISAEIVKREGGRIWVNSSEGDGATFYFSLPLKEIITNP